MHEDETLPITESANPASEELGQLDGRALAALMNAEDRSTVAAVERVLDAVGEAIEAIAEGLRRGGRLLYIGAGSSGRLGVLDASECPPTFGCDPSQVVGLIAGGREALWSAKEGAEDRADRAREDLDALDLQTDDCVVGISASGATPYPLAAVRHARAAGCLTVALSCNPDSALAAEAQIAITPIPGPEVLAGSTRLKAGTVTKMVLNMLSTGAMVRLGRTHGNRMTALRPGSEKLRQRARRILAELAQIDTEQAAQLLEQHHGDLRAALQEHPHRDSQA